MDVFQVFPIHALRECLAGAVPLIISLQGISQSFLVQIYSKLFSA